MDNYTIAHEGETIELTEFNEFIKLLDQLLKLGVQCIVTIAKGAEHAFEAINKVFKKQLIMPIFVINTR